MNKLSRLARISTAWCANSKPIMPNINSRTAVSQFLFAACGVVGSVMDSTQAILFLLVAVVMGWFAFGVLWNIRQGNAVLKWMQSGLPRLGEKTTLRWLGSSAVELSIAKARPPFRRVDLLLVLEPRDVPWFWLLARSRGRRDMLIVRGQLATAPP